MALIKCRECGHMISDKAIRCPNCGCPTKEETVLYQDNAPSNVTPVYDEEENHSNKWQYGVIGVLAVALVGLGIWAWQSGLFDGAQEQANQIVSDTAITDENTTNFDGLYQFKGYIGKYGVEMMATVDKGMIKTGLLHYNSQKRGVNLSLKGDVNKNGKMTINEYAPSGENTGRFEGTFDGTTFKGTFNSFYNGKTFPFTLSTVSTLSYLSEEDEMTWVNEEDDWESDEGIAMEKVDDEVAEAASNDIEYTSSTYEHETLSWLEGNWRYQMTSLGEVLEMRVGISGETIVVFINGSHHYSGRFTIEGNRLVYNRHNGMYDYLIVDRNNQRLMADERNPMQRF